jgi:hypothetical protein
MTITSFLFEAHLKCPTLCWLRAIGEPPSGYTYAEWGQQQKESYHGGNRAAARCRRRS